MFNKWFEIKSCFVIVMAGLLVLFSGAGVAGGTHKMSAVGKPVKHQKGVRLVQVDAEDKMRFVFSAPLNLEQGEIVTFEVSNNGLIPHEFAIGNLKEQQDHQAMMRKMPNMRHQDGNSVSLAPGETRRISWQFSGDEEVVFACNIPGHFEAGMFSKVRYTK